MKLKKALVLVLTAVVLLALLPGLARAEKELSIAGILFSDQIFPDSWNRLEVRVHNNSNKDFQGSVLVELGGGMFGMCLSKQARPVPWCFTCLP